MLVTAHHNHLHAVVARLLALVPRQVLLVLVERGLLPLVCVVLRVVLLSLGGDLCLIRLYVVQGLLPRDGPARQEAITAWKTSVVEVGIGLCRMHPGPFPPTGGAGDGPRQSALVHP
jgi:hypothetical protein